MYYCSSLNLRSRTSNDILFQKSEGKLSFLNDVLLTSKKTRFSNKTNLILQKRSFHETRLVRGDLPKDVKGKHSDYGTQRKYVQSRKNLMVSFYRKRF